MNGFIVLLFLPALYYLWFFLSHGASGSALLAVVILVSAMNPLLLARQEKPHPLWFRAHTHGYGWSPAAWQGWVIVLVMLGLVVFVGILVNANSHSVSDMLITAFPFWFLIFTTLFTIVQRTGEKRKH